MQEKKVPSKAPLAGVTVVLALLLGGFFLLFRESASIPGDLHTGTQPEVAASEHASPQAWQMDENFSRSAHTSRRDHASKPTAVAAQALVDEELVQRSLEKVKLDGEGNVIVDHDALRTLYDSLGYGGQRLTEQQLAYIEELIHQSLPAKAGSQTADIVRRFYRYLEAKQQVDEMYGYSDDAAEQRLRTDDLRALRRLFFGEDQAAQLFSRQEAHEDYMLANMALSADNSLTEAERDRQRKWLRETFLEPDFGISNWTIRRDSFLRQKQTVLDSSLSAAEKTEQIDALYARQFTQEEAPRIEHLDLKQPNE